jgi:hypothetical protein
MKNENEITLLEFLRFNPDRNVKFFASLHFCSFFICVSSLEVPSEYYYMAPLVMVF